MLTFIVVLLGWIFSLSLHEFAHALVAYNGGDTTVREKGYLTFNPLKYTHPIYSLLLPLLFLAMGGIGLPGGAVYIERWRLRGPLWETAVSLAGPFTNALLALVLGALLRFTDIGSTVYGPGLAFLAFLQVSAVVLNLIPLPPFDGFGAIEPHLPMGLRQQVAAASGWLPMIVFVLLWSVPAVYDRFWWLVGTLAHFASIPMQLAGIGFQQFRFWQ